jgi:hypothetical protein
MPDQPALSPEEVIKATQALAASRGAQAALDYIQLQFTGLGQDPRLLPLMAQLHAAQGQRAEALAAWDRLLPYAPADLRLLTSRHMAKRALQLQNQRIEANFYPTVEDVSRDVKAACADGDFGYALWTLSDVAYRLVKSLPMSRAAPSHDAQIDALCVETGAHFAEQAKIAPVAPDPSAPIVLPGHGQSMNSAAIPACCWITSGGSQTANMCCC